MAFAIGAGAPSTVTFRRSSPDDLGGGSAGFVVAKGEAGSLRHATPSARAAISTARMRSGTCKVRADSDVSRRGRTAGPEHAHALRSKSFNHELRSTRTCTHRDRHSESRFELRFGFGSRQIMSRKATMKGGFRPIARRGDGRSFGGSRSLVYRRR